MKLVLLMCVTVDGKIAKHAMHLADWTSKEDKKLFVSLTKQAGVCIMGKRTYDTIGRPLPGRLIVVVSRDTQGLQDIPGSLEYTNQAPAAILADLAARGFEKCILAGGATVNGMFLREGLIDEMIVTIEPRVFGTGIDLFADADVNQPLELLSVEHISDQVLKLRYRFKIGADQG